MPPFKPIPAMIVEQPGTDRVQVYTEDGILDARLSKDGTGEGPSFRFDRQHSCEHGVHLGTMTPNVESSGSGPVRVNSDEYRAGWERIFGKQAAEA